MRLTAPLAALEAAWWRLSTDRRFLRVLYYVWIVFPYPIRRPLTSLVILSILGMKRLAGINRRNALTPTRKLLGLSFWGVPPVAAQGYTLRVDGLVERPTTYTFEDILAMETVERQVRMDCVGGFRNNSTMKGVSLALLFQRAGLRPEAESAVFSCADGYTTTHRIQDLLEAEALLASTVNGEQIAKFGYPLRLAAPGTYGYKWAKWVVRVELVSGWPAGHWDRLGVPKRGRIGDIW